MSNLRCYHQCHPQWLQASSLIFHAVRSFWCACALVLGIFVAVAGLLMIAPYPAIAASLEGDITQPDTQSDISPVSPPLIGADLVVRLQTALRAMDLYQGNVTGKFDALTARAVRDYQRLKGFPETGIIDDRLVEQLEVAVSINKLLDQLATARQERTDSAREALLNHPATRDLISESLRDETANAARDPSQCFREPTVRCLLDEALESAKAVSRDEMRNWAFGELLVAQARAGLGDEARDTVRRISDPRLIISALGEIAKAQALSGRDDEALAAAAIIPETGERAKAYATIAEIAASAGRTLGATAAIAHLREDVRSIGSDAQRIAYLAQSSIILHRLEFERDAKILLASLKTQAQSISDASRRDSALRHVARAMVMTGDMVNAGNVLALIVQDSERTPVMISTAEAQLQGGETDAALATARAIDTARFRTVVLATIARGRALSGRRTEAFNILEAAYADKSTIRFPFARDYATSQIALAYAAIGSTGTPPDAAMFVRAARMAEEIKDDRLRAETAWLITFSRHDPGANGLEQSKHQATADTARIKSVPTQAWLLAELSENRASVGQDAWAWELFDQSLKISSTVTNPWGRARALTRLAQSLIYLAETSSPDTTSEQP